MCVYVKKLADGLLHLLTFGRQRVTPKMKHETNKHKDPVRMPELFWFAGSSGLSYIMPILYGTRNTHLQTKHAKSPAFLLDPWLFGFWSQARGLKPNEHKMHAFRGTRGFFVSFGFVVFCCWVICTSGIPKKFRSVPSLGSSPALSDPAPGLPQKQPTTLIAFC